MRKIKPQTQLKKPKKAPKEVRSKIGPGHVIHALVSEHKIILGFIEDLEKAIKAIQRMKNYNGEKEEFGKLRHIAEHLVAAGLHYRREEEVLFPELEKRGIVGPPQMMRMEHNELRRYKKELKKLAKDAAKMNFSVFRKRIGAVAEFVISTLPSHIFKEDNVLYPMALDAIREKKTWSQMKKACDKIGYCCFTPLETLGKKF